MEKFDNTPEIKGLILKLNYKLQLLEKLPYPPDIKNDRASEEVRSFMKVLIADNQNVSDIEENLGKAGIDMTFLNGTNGFFSSLDFRFNNTELSVHF